MVVSRVDPSLLAPVIHSSFSFGWSEHELMAAKRTAPSMIEVERFIYFES
jgi:hypothetical protein